MNEDAFTLEVDELGEIGIRRDPFRPRGDLDGGRDVIGEMSAGGVRADGEHLSDLPSADSAAHRCLDLRALRVLADGALAVPLYGCRVGFAVVHCRFSRGEGVLV
jgi:hypothetical protein